MVLYVLIAFLLLNRRHIFGGGREGRSTMQRALLVAVIIGLLCLLFIPETSFVLSAFDAIGAIGLDVVTVLVLLELRRYLDSAVRLFVGLPTLTIAARQAFMLFSDVPRMLRYAVTGAVALSWLAIGTSVALHCFNMRAG
jgi:hypothetical protein